MVSTGLEELDRLLGGEGYPDRSAVVVVGPPGIGKEALGYWFLRSGLIKGDYCLYVTRLAVSEVRQDIRAFRAELVNHLLVAVSAYFLYRSARSLVSLERAPPIETAAKA